MKPFSPPTAQITRALIIACVAVQIFGTLAGDDLREAMVASFGLIPQRLTGFFSPAAALTLLSSLFIHGGWTHLLLNTLFLAWVGRYVEWVVGRWRFAALYALGGVAGGLLQVAVDPASVNPVIGASGAIAAVFGCYAMVFARSRVSARKVLGLRVSSDALTALWYAAVWIGLQLLTGLAFNTGDGQIAIWTHIGGFVTGLLFAQPFVRGPQVGPG
jgi:membrane associated rhomboid family serine protease